MNNIIDAELKKILSDKTSGSAHLLSHLNNYFLRKHDNKKLNGKIIPILKNNFKSFENIQKYLQQIDSLIRRGKLTQDFFLTNADQHLLNEKIFSNALPFLQKKNIILTISNSWTVFELIKKLAHKNKKLEIIVCESRPKLEGRILASRLAKNRIKVSLITESMIARFVQKADAVLIGADAILRSGDVVNKVGSKTLAVLCKEFKKLFFVAADKSKFTAKSKFQQNEEDRKEIWLNTPKGISIKNFYFEVVPKSYITKIFTD